MKKIGIVALVCFILLSITGCGENLFTKKCKIIEPTQSDGFVEEIIVEDIIVENIIIEDILD